MDDQRLETLEKIRQQFDRAPYPRTPLEKSPQQDYNELFIHNLVTPYYLRYQQVVETSSKTILDVGCGSGYTSLTLATANPGARVVGIDLSDESIKLCRERVKHHGVENTEFHTLSLDDVPQLGLTFDYINCDEVLYLLPDPVAGLKAMESVLAPKGIIRANLHNAFQRQGYYRSQALFQTLGLMEENPGDFAAEVVIETMKSLKDDVMLKASNWNPRHADPENEEGIMMNHLLVGDKGFTIVELFNMLRSTDLEFVSMVDWRRWEVTDLFKDDKDLPAFWGMSLMGASIEDRLRLYELLHPIHRLMDFWCARPDEAAAKAPVDAWTDDDWQQAMVQLHPQLRQEAIREAVVNCAEEARLFQISRFIDLPTLGPVFVDSMMAACLLPLWDGAQPFNRLVDRYLKLKPLSPVTLEPTSTATAFEAVKQLLNQLDAFLYVLLERSTGDAGSSP